MSDPQTDFDVNALLALPLQLFGLAAGAVETTRQTMSSVVATVESLQRSAAGLESLIRRLDDLVAVVEGPTRALIPEVERATAGLRMLTDAVDLMPLDQLPQALNRLNGQLASFVDGLGDMPQRLGGIGDLIGGLGLFGRKPAPPEPPSRPVVPSAPVKRAVKKPAPRS